MGQQTWVEMSNAYGTSGISSLTSKEFTAIQPISPGGSTLGQAFTLGATVPVLVPGKIIRWTAKGYFGTTGTPELTLSLCWGETGKVLGSSKVKCPSGTPELSWSLNALTRVISSGTAGKVITQGEIYGIEAKSALSESASVTMLPLSAPLEVEVDTSTQKALFLAGTWSASSSSNTITVTQWVVEILN